MDRTPSRTSLRRARLALRLASLEAMEPRSLVTESLGVFTAGIGVPAAIAITRPEPGRGDASTPISGPAKGQRAQARPSGLPRPPSRRAAPAPAGHASLPVAATPPRGVADEGDWLTLGRSPVAPDRASSAASQPQNRGPGQGGTDPGDPGVGSSPATGAITPLRLASPQVDPAAGGVAVAAAGVATSAAGTTARPSAPAPTQVATGPTTAVPSPAYDSGGRIPAVGPVSTIAAMGSAAALGSFTNFPLYVLDWNYGTVLFPGATQYAALDGYVNLRAQVRDTTVSTYSWDTTNLTGATGITGTSSYRLQFEWTNNNPTSGGIFPSTTLTVTDNLGHQEVQTYSFWLPQGSVGHQSGGAPTVTWPETLAPNTLLPSAPAFPTHNASVDAASGSLDVTIPLPSYNPNLQSFALTYNSVLADPRPIVVEHHIIDPAQAVPTKVGAKLTFNGTAGTMYYYDTGQFNAGAVQQVALQADATGLSTGRYSYTVTVDDVRSSTTTTTASGTATVLNGSGNAFGAGWTLAGLQKITTATGGVIVDLGAGGRSLWFATGGGSGGSYTSPSGDFSTLTSAGGVYTRTMPDGTVYRFNGSGQETSVADRNGLRVTFTYDSGGKLSTAADPYGKVTTFTYDGSNKLSKVTDPAGRVATVTHSGSDLSGVTLPDGNTWSYSYDAAHRLTQVTDPRSKVVTVAYDSAQRASTITRPDSTAETYKAFQLRGYDTSGTSGSPAPATLLAESRATYTDPNGHKTDARPDWNGQGLLNQSTDPDGYVSTYDRKSNGLATVVVDRLNRVSRYAYDSKGNVTSLTYYDGNTVQASYNSFAEPTSTTDELNHITTYTYDGSGNLTVVQDPLGNLTTMTYTGNGKLATVKDARSNVTSYAYDSQDRLTTVTHPDSSTEIFGYDSYGNVNSATDERSKVTTYSFDALNRTTGTTDALANRTTYTYDAVGNPTAIQAPLGRTTTYAYDAMDRVTTVTDPLSHSSVYGYDPGGNLATMTDPLGRVTSFAYDAEDRRTAVTDPMSHRTTTTYDAEGQPLTVTDPLGRVTTTTYNSRGWVSTVTDPLGHVTTHTYTATGKPSTVVSPYASGGSTEAYTYDNADRLIAVSDALSHITTYGYDAVGNRITVTDALSHTTTFAYDVRDRVTTVTDPLSHSIAYGYDAAGNRITVTDALSHTTTYAYDALNRATTLTDARGGVTTIAFDAAGRRTGLTDPVGNATTWAYDAADRMTTMTDPLGHSATYSYDNANQLSEKTDRNGRRTTFSYDSGGRKTGETWVAASPANAITYTYDAADQLTGVADANATLTYTYDSGGRQITAATSGTAGQPGVTLTSAYDAFGNRTSLTDNLSSVGITTYSYDQAFRLTSIARSLGGVAGPQVVYGYDNANRLSSQSRTIGGSGTAVTTSFSYDNANRLTTLTHQVAGGSGLATYVYGYDNANRVTSEQNAEGTVTYTYDDTDQLTGASGSRAETYTYDLTGNRTMSGYATSTGNQLTASPGATYAYDNEGNLTAQTNTASHVETLYAYDYRNRLINVTVGGTVMVTNTYDAAGRRIGIKENGTQKWSLYDGQNVYADFEDTGALVTRYLLGSGIDTIIAQTKAAGATFWYLPDTLNTIRDIASSAGSIVDHITYDSYGIILAESAPGNGDRFKFTGREYNSITNLYYNRARYYSPATGRFSAQDPIAFQGNDVNLYRYVYNSPAVYTDPWGLTGQTPREPLQSTPMTKQDMESLLRQQYNMIQQQERDRAQMQKMRDEEMQRMQRWERAKLIELPMNKSQEFKLRFERGYTTQQTREKLANAQLKNLQDEYTRMMSIYLANHNRHAQGQFTAVQFPPPYKIAYPPQSGPSEPPWMPWYPIFPRIR